MSEPTWREDLDNLLATAGEAQWVEEIDTRLTALIEGQQSRLDSLQKERDAIMRSHRSVEEMLIARERALDVASSRLDAVRTLVATWRQQSDAESLPVSGLLKELASELAGIVERHDPK